MKNFFDLIFAKVVPKRLFGSITNLKKIKRATFQLLDTPCFKYFNLKPIIEKLDVCNFFTIIKLYNKIKIHLYILDY